MLLQNATDIIPFIDLTSLNDNEDSIIQLCQRAQTPFGSVAAICVYSQFVKLAVNFLSDTSIKIATVINFPGGDLSLSKVLFDINSALQQGANEIDIVFPYQVYLKGKKEESLNYIVKAKELCINKAILKVIIETGVLVSSRIISSVCIDVIQAGANFIKTSTGKTSVGATLEAATTILTTIKENKKLNEDVVGLKVSGGIRTIEQAQSYISLCNEIMGSNWINPITLRFGASKLLDEILSGKL